ncbi:UDP-glucose 4-epimerase-like isoform X1 [Varroa destructor]|uniref:UDP-glucose 4-epimerase n=1 Tax=Varroa destructor TaxID=109461 RepID=A0A7M7K9J4_VARDE|nr:UDP-glucose 4-epimerase-like isoform X1 [Varroa destructor]
MSSHGSKCVFVTGGAGFIGSHTIIELLNANYEVVVVDNFANCVMSSSSLSSPSTEESGGQGSSGSQMAESLIRVQDITGKKIHFYACDLLNKIELSRVFKKHKVDCVIHLAAMKAVGESMQKPLFYYKNNIVSTINVLEVMKEQGVYKMVFSSSCVVYGNPIYLPIDEVHPAGDVPNVYGRTKYAIEKMLEDIARAEKQWNIICLRYFNPLGAHPSGRIGEDPVRAFTNLMPIIGEVAMGKRKELDVYGGDYDTPDGTGVRDFIHVMDLAAGHVAALRALDKPLRFKFYNLGTGRGTSILQLIRIFEEVTGRTIPYRILERRLGDIPAIWGDCRLAETELEWKAKYTVKDMCQDFWKWLNENPNGYPRVTEIIRPRQ